MKKDLLFLISCVGLLVCGFAAFNVFWLLRQAAIETNPCPTQDAPLLVSSDPSVLPVNKTHNKTQHVCTQRLQEIMETFDCWLQQSEGRFQGENPRSSCPHVAAPMFQYSFMFGQGFGRIISQGVRNCLMATVLHRPCVIDLARDRYLNLRAFIKAGPYDWETGAQVVLAQSGANISHALHQMKSGLQQGQGWEDVADLPDYEDVLPMVWGNESTSAKSLQRHLNMWDGSNNTNKTLVSPNFGDSCLTLSKSWELFIGRESPCPSLRMISYLQNLMFVPTSLAHELYRERRALVLHEKEILDMDTVKNEALPPYGAIHLRMNILNRDVYKMGVTKEQIVEGLKKCFKSKKENHRDVKKWWLISDDMETAEHVMKEFDNVFSHALHVETKGLGEEEVKENFKGTHSGAAMNRKFGQESLAPSVIDWMALHESEVSFITYDSAYGESGARGNGKFHEAANICGGTVIKEGGLRAFPMFLVYEKDKNM